MQVTIEYVPKEVVRLIPLERVQQRTVEQIVHVPVPQVVEETAKSGPDHSQERISKRIIDRIVDVPIEKRRQALSIQTVQKTSEVPQIQRRWSSRRRKQSRCSTAAHRQGG